MKIVIVDYGMGNIRSLVGALSFIGCENVDVSSSEPVICSADRLILPGVGNFGSAMKNIKKLSLDSILESAICEKSIPVLGICLGMQLLCRSSTEAGFTEGLKLVDADVVHMGDLDVPIPHVGFNQVRPDKSMKLFTGIDDGSDFYFTHSYKVEANTTALLCFCSYSIEFVCGFERGNIAGVQFHPELSQRNGLKLLSNFMELF
jgi:glutamine amidotransferase